jgi:putative transport protein
MKDCEPTRRNSSPRLLLSGVIVSSMASRLRFFSNTPNAPRNILEDLGLVVFVAIVGVNAGNSLLTQLTGALALKIFIAGFVACTIPPFAAWAIGYHFMKINPAVPPVIFLHGGWQDHVGFTARRKR